MVEFLIQQRADIHAFNSSGNTPLYSAVASTHIEGLNVPVVTLLLRNTVREQMRIPLVGTA